MTKTCPKGHTYDTRDAVRCPKCEWIARRNEAIDRTLAMAKAASKAVSKAVAQ